MPSSLPVSTIATLSLPNSPTDFNWSRTLLLESSPRSTDHIIPILINLHWLPVQSFINLKTGLTYKALHNLAPNYLSNLLSVYASSRSLRSSSTGLLVTPSFHHSTMGARAFSCWNETPPTHTTCRYNHLIQKPP